MIIKIKPKIILYGREIQKLCRQPYYKHPRGCPNFDRKMGCPPKQDLIDRILDFTKELFLIYTEFDVGSFARRMWQMHPYWTERQAYNCRLWQPTARKLQRTEETNAITRYGLTKIVNSPEAHGVNVEKLLKDLNIIVEWPPRSTARIISLGGFIQ